jgi:uncharacterized protein (TIGR02099 family)
MHPVESAEEFIDAILPPQGRRRRVARIAGWGLMAAYLVFAAMVLALRYWILPSVGAHTADIERFVSSTVGERVTIGAIEAGWQGLRPELLLENVTVHDRNGRPALSLPAVEATFAWTSVLVGSPRFYSLVFDRPNLEIRRDAGGRFFVAGMELRSGREQDAGIAAWILSQREVAIRDASITWTDEQRGAPTLALSQVNLVVRDGGTHRFALRARPPQVLASTLEVRGELHGADLADPRTWSGQVYTELEYADLVAWKPWLDYPFALESGRGGVRLWLGFADKALNDVVADVALAQVVTRLGKDLPLLELDFLQGRLGAKQDASGGFEVFGKKVTLRTGAGIALSPADFRVRWRPAADPARQKGEFEASALELAPLAKLAGYLPFPQRARERLAAAELRGTIRDLEVAWTGDAESPQRFSLRGGFSDLAASAYGRIPEFSGLTGRVDADERSGSLSLKSQQVTVDLPGTMAESRIRLDSLTAQINWKSTPDRFELGFNNLSLANRDFAGTLFGTFATKPGSPGVIDVTGNFSRAEGTAVYRYIPGLPQVVAEYLKASILGGSSRDVRLRIKGDLAKFPFEDPAAGIFQVVARVDNAEFRYVEGWPEAREMSGDLIFEGKSMRIAASHARVLDVRSGNVRAVVPDLYHGNEHVQLDIRADDPTGDFLDFISRSPVSKYLDGFTDGLRATGSGRLSLRFDLPIQQPDRITLDGSYEIENNQIRLDGDMPALSQVRGRIEFTESSVKAKSIEAQFLGGPAAISIDTRGDGAIVASAEGTASAAQLPRSRVGTMLRQLSGSTAWQATLTSVRHQAATLLIRSQLTGISADLPAPLGKTAFEAMPLQVERVSYPGSSGKKGGDSIRVSLGRSLNAYFQRRRERDGYVTERGVISLNQPAVLPESEGIAVTGNLAYLDFDRWRTLVDGDGAGGASSLALDLKVSALDFAGRRLNDLDLRAGTRGSVWNATVKARELDGEIAWNPEGQGRIVARLKRFTMPEPAPGDADAGKPSTNLPELDIVADSLFMHDDSLGRLELVAVNQGPDWRIQKLILSGAESTLEANGVWRNWAAQPRVEVHVNLDVKDVGKYLDRMGYPRTVQRGSATLEGDVSWAGSPQAIDFPTLSGNLKLDAKKGQFLKADPGVAKLLGVLSLQSWVTLDFPRVFGEGFGFDKISCSASIANGVLATPDFKMQGPAAEVKMSGSVDLVRETQDLQARVTPTLGDSVSAAAILVNPIWGLPLILLQRILKDPLGQIFAVDYEVTGTWTEPKVKNRKANVSRVEASTQ